MLAVIETHPIQYHAPVYRHVQQRYGIPVTAIYGSDFSISGYRDAGFDTTFAWDTDLLSGYSPVFLSQTRSGGARSADRVSTRGLRRVLRDLNPAAVLTVGYSPRFHRDAWLAAWRTGVPLLFRGETSDEARRRPFWKQVGRDAALRIVYRTCSRVLYVGRESRAHFERHGVHADRLVFSPYCVDTTVFRGGEADRIPLRAAARREMGIGEDERVLLFSGKLIRNKGVDVLVEAARLLPQDVRSKTTLAFVGDGHLRSELASAANVEPTVKTVFLGFRNQQELSPWYHAADLLVLPSRDAETWGLVVNEALHHGLPCVVSDNVGCRRDLIDPGRTGEVAEAGSPAALAASIARAGLLVNRRPVRDACRTVIAGYTVDRAAAGIAEAYHAAVATRAAA